MQIFWCCLVWGAWLCAAACGQSSLGSENVRDGGPAPAVDAGPDASCEEGQLSCDGACVSPVGNPNHCGACGNRCENDRGSATCALDVCLFECEPGTYDATLGVPGCDGTLAMPSLAAIGGPAGLAVTRSAGKLWAATRAIAGDRLSVWVASHEGTTWSAPMRADDKDVDHAGIPVIAGSGDDVWILNRRREGQDPPERDRFEIVALHYAGSGWTESVLESDVGTTSSYRVVPGEGGTATAIWVSDDGLSYAEFARGAWAPSATIQSGGAALLQAARLDDGDLVLAFFDQTDRVAKSTRLSPTGFSPPTAVNPTTTTLDLPIDMAVVNGRTVLVYHELDEESSDALRTIGAVRDTASGGWQLYEVFESTDQADYFNVGILSGAAPAVVAPRGSSVQSYLLTDEGWTPSTRVEDAFEGDLNSLHVARPPFGEEVVTLDVSIDGARQGKILHIGPSRWSIAEIGAGPMPQAEFVGGATVVARLGAGLEGIEALVLP